MLKALQLVGFKSFADKTRFEFPPGITVVVGPNGSGKSNIVDGIKWVLGEQSVKSLRGKEMADVIFNGSGTRRAQNSAEVVLTFANQDGLLPLETPEVHVARRVYRSGEGEYLINGQPCRLRDIKDTFAGTGVSAQHYSIIEQGKVDSMLQASPRDRRMIFEEAAGISRFKAKKLESLRRLERVEQNLLRLSDIVDEVENRLRMVRKQAGKAKRYKEYTDRLQELRTQVALTDWRQLTERLEELQEKLTEIKTKMVELAAKNEAIEARSLALEGEIEEAQEVIRSCEKSVGENRERIASCESTIDHERSRRRDLDEEIERRRKQLTSMNSRSRDLGSQLENTTKDVTAAESRFRQVREHASEIDRALAALDSQCDALRADNEQRRQRHMERLRQKGELGNETTSLETKIESASAAFRRAKQQLDQLTTERAQASEDWKSASGELEQLDDKLAACSDEFAVAKQQLDDSQKQLNEAHRELSKLQSEYAGAKERAAVLEELERRHEGIGSGVKEVLVASRENPDGPFRDVCCLVANAFEVPVEMAPMIEIALGQRAGYLVVTPGSGLIHFLQQSAHPFSGRVGFIPLEAPENWLAEPEIRLDGRPGVIGRADRFVRAEPRFAGLARRLLADTWIVEDLARAISLSESAHGASFVTLAGQHLAADGTLCVGPKQGTTGLISRRSELRTLHQRLDDLKERMELNAGEVESLSETVADAHANLETLAEQREDLQRRVAECQRRVSAVEERKTQLSNKHQSVHAELDLARNDVDAATSDLAIVRDRCREIDDELASEQELLAADQRGLQKIEAERQVRTGEATAAKVELAICEQHLQNLTNRLRQFEQDQAERQRALDEAAGHLQDAQTRAAESERRTLQLEGQVAELYLCKEELAKQLVRHAEHREQLRGERGQLVVEGQKVRTESRKLEAENHNQDLAAEHVRMEREALEARMREDYEIELAELRHEPTEEEQHEREEVEEEINSLRRKISNIGNVNLDALDELNGLESRFTELSTQLQDLTSAKKSLEEIIEKINVDSRQLFIDTLESVRTHFQVLFRKLFGGGQADIIIEDGVDILESGLEIVARPPGKEPRSISLLSGGEKTLTCVALLMAIFRNRPSPFCVLDEVDAALDEANIERFISVLEDFLQWTQFIIITHSKKTMTCANTLYGVTMQESGISKRVSVRFEDVSETGEILRTVDENDGSEDGSSDSSDETQAA